MRSLVFLLLFVCATASAQTTFILVRHAEKESGNNDPDLTAAGHHRAQLLAKMFAKQPVDAIYSTNYKRTKNTVKPLADAKGLPIQTTDPDLASLKGTIVICGHSNTIPALANKLLGKDQFQSFDDGDYGNLLIIKDGAVVHLTY